MAFALTWWTLKEHVHYALVGMSKEATLSPHIAPPFVEADMTPGIALRYATPLGSSTGARFNSSQFKV
jgi:hypothetical protein